MMFPPRCKQNHRDLPPACCRALYVHVPFCAAKCAYCDFYSVAFDDAASTAYVHAAAAEWNAHAHQVARPLESVYVGGGTPTVLPVERLSELLDIPRAWRGPETEFSVEANPGTLDLAKAAALTEAGVNRVTLGAQSFDDAELQRLGRIHSAAQARQAAGLLRAAGIDNLGLDLIYGIPGQSFPSWDRTLAEALALAPQHVSCYALSFEPGTPMAAALHAGEVREMDEDLQEACYRRAIEACARAGLEQYELSNFARPGRPCRHNLTYCRNEPYLGIGPAAASYLGGLRRTNRPDLGAYVGAHRRGVAPPATGERLAGRAAMAETVMLALRLLEGLDRKCFMDRYGQDVGQAFPQSLARHVALGMLEVTASHVRFTSQALFVADAVLADILAEA